MARIISGQAGSLPLTVPKGPTRPTSDRVREAIFSALEHRVDVEGSSVVDLYAGSGALGLEAVSRGAIALIAVESHRGACEAIRRNAERVRQAVGRELSVTVHQSTVSSFLASHPDLSSVDVVFVDPPYDVGEEPVAAVLAELRRLLSDGALIVLERRAKGNTPEWPAGLVPLSDKTYGDTRVFTLELSR